MATRTRKVLMGCGVGCLGILALTIGACLSFSLWIRQPGDLLAPTRLLGSDTTGYVEWTLRVEDPGSEAFAESLIDLQQRAQDRNPARGPSWMTAILKSSQTSDNAQAVRAMMPSVVAWTIRPGETEDSDLHLFTLSVESLGNRTRFMDLILRYTVGLKRSVKHGNERIYSAEDTGSLFIRDNTFFVTNSEDNARLIVDRLSADIWTQDRDPTALELQMSAVAVDQPLHGAIRNDRGELARIWATLADEDAAAVSAEFWNAMRGATLSGGFAGQTSLEAIIDFQGPDSAWAEANAEDFTAALRSTWGRGHLSVAFQPEVIGDTIRVELRIENVFSFIDEM